MKRRKFTASFKTKVVLEILKERQSIAEIAQKYEVHPQQLQKWKRDFLDNAEGVFQKKIKSAKTQQEEEKARLLKTIGELKVENDFLKEVLQ